MWHTLEGHTPAWCSMCTIFRNFCKKPVDYFYKILNVFNKFSVSFRSFLHESQHQNVAQRVHQWCSCCTIFCKNLAKCAMLAHTASILHKVYTLCVHMVHRSAQSSAHSALRSLRRTRSTIDDRLDGFSRNYLAHSMSPRKPSRIPDVPPAAALFILVLYVLSEERSDVFLIAALVSSTTSTSSRCSSLNRTALLFCPEQAHFVPLLCCTHQRTAPLRFALEASPLRAAVSSHR